HKMFLQVGYGLEGVLPDALCKRIIDEQISPRFRAGDFDGGLTAGVQSIIAATKGEYKGTGRTVAETHSYARQHDNNIGIIVVIFFFIVFGIVFFSAIRRTGGYLFTGGGWGSGSWGGSSGGSWGGGGG